MNGVELSSQPEASTSGTSHNSEASVLIFGMRGSGKTYLGQIAASELGWEYVDADQYLEDAHKMTCKEFVMKHGWDEFRATETRLLPEILTLKPTKTVISLGGGIVETKAARDILKEYARRKGPVVHISRDIRQIVEYLTNETERPAYSQEIEDVFARRMPWFDECCSHRFVSIVEPVSSSSGESLRQTQRTTREVGTFFRHITRVLPNLSPKVDLGQRSYFLSLTFPDIVAQKNLLDENRSDILTGIDAVELRVDLLSPHGPAKQPNIPPREYVIQQLAQLKHITSLPVVYTVRTITQGGAFPDKAHDELISLLELGLQMGAEYIDVETTLPHPKIQKLTARKGASKLLASYHDWSGNLRWSGTEIEAIHTTASSLGDIVKIVGKANSLEENMELREFAKKVKKTSPGKPIIAINLGEQGQLSRILNETFTPVTHSQLPVAAAPGQLSFSQIQGGLHLLGQLPSKRFYLFGNPISKSPSPTLHNSGFHVLGLPHRYELHETEAVDESVRSIIRSPTFGGASVTIPHKLSIMDALDELSPAAKLIGAVNTIIPVAQADGTTTLLGDNTDWQGIKNAILARSSSRWTVQDTGLIVGAGGTARAAVYALKQLGIGPILLWNRTHSSATQLASSFPTEYNITVLSELSEVTKTPPSIVIGTVPASATTEGGVKLAPEIFGLKQGGVVVEMAYRPKITPLLELASKSTSKWTQVYGVDVLLEQGLRQFELWTTLRAPRRAITENAVEFYNAV